MNSTANASSEIGKCSSLFSSKAFNIGGIVALCLILLVTLAGNSLIVMLVYKTPNLRKPINYFIANMASSDLLFILYMCHGILARLNISWIIGSQFGQAFCKLISFLPAVSTFTSIQNLILIAVDRFGAVVFPLRSPLIRSKLCPFFILATWIVAGAVSSPYVFAAKLVENSGRNSLKAVWSKRRMEGSIGGVLVLSRLHNSDLYLLYLHPCTFVSHSLLLHLYQTHGTGAPRWTFVQHWTTTAKKKQKCASYVHCYHFSVCVCLLPFVTNELILVYRSSSTHFSCSFSLYYEVTFNIVAAYVH